MRTGSWVRSGAKRRYWRISDGVDYPVTVRYVTPKVAS